MTDLEREPTTDEQLGMAWFNALLEGERAYWLGLADTAVPAVAWAEFQRRQGGGSPAL